MEDGCLLAWTPSPFLPPGGNSMQLPPKHPGVGEVRYPDLRRSGMDSTGDAIGYTFATASVESFGSTANELIFFTKLNWQKKLV